MKLIKTGELEIDLSGRIWRNKTRGGIKSGGSRLNQTKRRRAEQKTPVGYLTIRAMFNYKRIYASAHRVVWQYFHGNIPANMTINHKNGIKYDNRPENIEVVTMSENMKHAFKNNLRSQWGETNPHAKLSNKDVEIIRNEYATGNYTQKEIGIIFNVCHQTISGIVRGTKRQRENGETDNKDRRLFYNTPRDKITGRFISKKKAGRLLYGREWNQFPEG